jgi:hypothetical protein
MQPQKGGKRKLARFNVPHFIGCVCVRVLAVAFLTSFLYARWHCRRRRLQA